MDNLPERPYVLAATAGVLTAIVTAIIYFMKLSIFSQAAIEWFFVIGLVSAAVAIFSIVVKDTYRTKKENY